jgi:hypothetical protein
LEFLRTTRARVGAALLTSLVVVALAVLLKYPLPIVPAILVAVWMPVYAPRVNDTPLTRRLLLASVGGLGVLAGVGVLVFVIVAA